LLSELLHDADMKLFRSMLRSTHCIHQLLPPLKFIPMKLRTSHCAFVLPYCHYSLYKHSFVLRCIFDGAYWLSSCQAACVCCLCLLPLLPFYWYCLLFVRFRFILIFLYCKIVIFTVCCFSVLLDGVWLSRIKRITYLLTYLIFIRRYSCSATDIILSKNNWSLLPLCFTWSLESTPFIDSSNSFWYRFLYFPHNYYFTYVTGSHEMSRKSQRPKLRKQAIG